MAPKLLRGIAGTPLSLLVITEVTNRYRILDILSQDGSGVSFYAEDRESGTKVVVRRFFPFGAEGGGLKGQEKSAYQVAVRRLMELSHPALRRIRDGGVDPNDGMPYLVTEWIEGELLSDRLADGPLSSESVRAIADLALDTSEALSEIFGEEAIWVETHPSAIVVSNDDPERQLTFWISPLRWLGPASERSNLKPLLEMVEDLSGWRGQVVSRSSGGGLGAWVKALRDQPDIWSLSDARNALHEPATIVEQSASEATVPARQASHQPRVVFDTRPVHWPWILAGTLALGAAGILAWRNLLPLQPPPLARESSPSEPIAPPQTRTKAPRESDRIAAMNRTAAAMSREAESSPIIIQSGTTTVAGKILRTEASISGKSRYLLFEEHEGKRKLWAMFRTADWADFDPEALDKMVGSKARFTGEWRSENSKRESVLRMPSSDCLKLVD